MQTSIRLLASGCATSFHITVDPRSVGVDDLRGTSSLLNVHNILLYNVDNLANNPDFLHVVHYFLIFEFSVLLEFLKLHNFIFDCIDLVHMFDGIVS